MADDHLDAPAGSTRTTAPSAPSTPERPAPSGRPTRRPRWPYLAAAVIVLVVGLGIGALVIRSSEHAEPGTERRRSSTTEHTTGSPAPGAVRANVADLGAFRSSTALRQALRVAIPAVTPGPSRSVADLTQAQIDRCAGVIEARDPGLVRANRRRTVAATISGEPVLVLEYQTKAVRTGRPTTRVVALGVAACDDRLDFER